MDRGGQVFFVHNRVRSLATWTRHVREMVPEARVGMAHGQMPEKELAKVEAMISSMTMAERHDPKMINPSRKQRIAKGSGVTVTEVNSMLNKFNQMQQMMKKFGKFQRMMAKMGGGLPGMLR